MQRPLRFLAWLQVVSTLALSLPAGAAEQPPKAQDVVTEEAKQWASAAADAYHDTHLKPAERLENAEAKLHAAQKHCGTSKDCVNLLYFGLGCVYEDQHKLLRQKSVALQAQGKTAEALQIYALAERRLLAALNAYERFTSQREHMTELTEEIPDEVVQLLPQQRPTLHKAPPSRDQWPLACVDKKPHLPQALAGIAWLRERVRATHGRLIVVIPSSFVSFSINETENQLVRQAEKPLPIWLPAGRHVLTWEPTPKEQQREEFAIFPFTDTKITLAPPPSAPEPVPAIAAPAPPPAPAAPRKVRRWGLVVGGGISAAVGVAGVILGATALAVNGQCVTTACEFRYDGTILGAVALPAGLVLLGTGATLLGFGLTSVARAPRPSARLLPVVGSGQAGIVLTGEF